MVKISHGIAKHGQTKAQANPKSRTISAGIMPKDSEMELMKNIVLKRHHEWRKPAKSHYWLYLFLITLFFTGLLLSSGKIMKISPLASVISFVFTILAGSCVLLLMEFRQRQGSFNQLEEKVENEILSFKLERANRR